MTDLDPTLLPLDRRCAACGHRCSTTTTPCRTCGASPQAPTRPHRCRDASPRSLRRPLGDHERVAGHPRHPPHRWPGPAASPGGGRIRPSAAIELDELWGEHGGADLPSLDEDQIVALRNDLRIFGRPGRRRRRCSPASAR
ncbi:MAG: hypothetical protein R2713_11475 [Ilumatobacteraceae bacterium]